MVYGGEKASCYFVFGSSNVTCVRLTGLGVNDDDNVSNHLLILFIVNFKDNDIS